VKKKKKKMELDLTPHTETTTMTALQNNCYEGMSQGHRGRGRPRNTWKRDLEREMWTAGFSLRWQKMAAQDREDEWSVAYAPLGATRHS